jgi:hypothetical protein
LNIKKTARRQYLLVLVNRSFEARVTIFIPKRCWKIWSDVKAEQRVAPLEVSGRAHGVYVYIWQTMCHRRAALGAASSVARRARAP